MLGTEPQVVETYVESGAVRIVFWPVLNHGDPSLLSTLAATCVAQQDIDAFWKMHHYLFENQMDLWRAGPDYYVEAATGVGAERELFEACFNSPEALNHVLELDTQRRARGIYTQPVFDINGEIIHGYQSFDTLSNLIENALSQ